jgi:uncharacterized protein (DUF427 family)
MTENEAQVRSWQSCVIDDIIQQTPSIKSFFLRLSKPFAHTAGQHVDIRLVSAIWKDTTIATSDETVIVEGNHYFPPSGVDLSLLEMSPHTSVCPIKGAARFFHVRAGDALNVNAAWTYPAPTPDAEGIRDYIAFWKGVDVA